MRIGLDVQRVLDRPSGGRTYVLELLPELLALAADDDQLVLWHSSNGQEDWPETIVRLRRHSNLIARRLPLVDTDNHFWRHLRFPAVERIAGEAPLDVCHTFGLPALPSKARRTVLTLTAFRNEDGDENWQRQSRPSRWLRRSIDKAHSITLPSQAACSLAQARFPEAADRMVVVYPGIHSRFRQPPKPDQVAELCQSYPFLEEPYLLVAGAAAEPLESVPFLLSAWRQGRQLEPNLPPLVLLADPDHAGAISDLLGRGGRAEDIYLLTDLPTTALTALYRGAELLLDPGFGRAFGMALLEAAACGVAAVAGVGRGALEVMADGAFLCDRQEDVWAEAIVELHKNPALRRQLARQGQRAVEDSTWRTAAEKHWQLYQQ